MVKIEHVRVGDRLVMGDAKPYFIVVVISIVEIKNGTDTIFDVLHLDNHKNSIVQKYDKGELVIKKNFDV